jgi:hypothetical protein
LVSTYPVLPHRENQLHSMRGVVPSKDSAGFKGGSSRALVRPDSAVPDRLAGGWRERWWPMWRRPAGSSLAGWLKRRWPGWLEARGD